MHATALNQDARTPPRSADVANPTERVADSIGTVAGIQHPNTAVVAADIQLLLSLLLLLFIQ